MLRQLPGVVPVLLILALTAGALPVARVAAQEFHTVRTGPEVTPSREDRARDRASDKGLFRVVLSGQPDPAPLGLMLEWEIRIVAPDGTPVTEAEIAVSGVMPDQNHVMQSEPRMTRVLGDGYYRIEGVKFDRQGWWHLKFAIESDGKSDTVAFSIMVGAISHAEWSDEWSEAERAILRSLWIGSLPNPPPDPSNAVADDPRAAEFGLRLFFDARLSADGSVSCSTCHQPELAFTDGRKIAEGVGRTIRNAPTLMGAAWSPWFFWDGRKDSLWAQAQEPFVNPLEHGISAAQVLEAVAADPDYRRRYAALFGALPRDDDPAGRARAYANIAKALAAYERTLIPAPSRFDRYVEAVLQDRPPPPDGRLTVEELMGLRVFISANQGQCIRCHNGPMFTNHQFHNIGSQISPHRTERGRATAIDAVLADPSNCLGPLSDAPKEACKEIRFAKRTGPEMMGAFKTPTLRFLPRTGPYLHAGQIDTLNDVMWHYRDRPRAAVGTSELQPLTMGDAEFSQIEAFLRTLDSDPRVDLLHTAPAE